MSSSRQETPYFNSIISFLDESKKSSTRRTSSSSSGLKFEESLTPHPSFGTQYSSTSNYTAYHGYQHQPQQIRSTHQLVPNRPPLEYQPLEYTRGGISLTELNIRKRNKHQQQQILSTQRLLPVVDKITANRQPLPDAEEEQVTSNDTREITVTDLTIRNRNLHQQQQILSTHRLLPVVDKITAKIQPLPDAEEEQVTSNDTRRRTLTEKNVGKRPELFYSFNTARVSDKYEDDENQTPVRLMASSDVRMTVNNKSYVQKGINYDELTSKASIPKKSNRKSKKFRLRQENKVISSSTCENTSTVKSMQSRQEISDSSNLRLVREKYGRYEDQSCVNKMVRSDVQMPVNNMSSEQNVKKTDEMMIERRKSSVQKFVDNGVQRIEMNKSATQIKSDIDVSTVEQEMSSKQNQVHSVINYEKTSSQSVVSNEKRIEYSSKCNNRDLTENRNTTYELKSLKQKLKFATDLSVNYGPSDRVYKNCSEPRGLVFIKNFASFDDVNKYMFRDGSVIDFTNIVCLFDQLGYEIWDKSETGNIKHSKFMEDLHAFSQMDHSKYDSSVIAIMSHGVGNEIFVTSDGKKCYLEKVYEEFNSAQCSSLSGKPKLFILQFCRRQSELKRSVSFTINEEKARKFGIKYYLNKIIKNVYKTDPAAEELHKNELQPWFKQRKPSLDELEEFDASSRINNSRGFPLVQDMEEFQHDAAKSSVPVLSQRRSDMYTIFSTGAGGLAFRHRNKGSLLIQAMCEIFTKDAHHDDIDELFKKVLDHMNSQLSKEDPTWTSQHQPVEIHMQGFGKKFYFNPYHKRCSRCQNCRCCDHTSRV